MKPLLVAALTTFAVACGSTPPPASAPVGDPSSATAPASAAEASTAAGVAATPSAQPAAATGDAAGGCSRALAAATPPKEGEECGGTTHVTCASGLTCVAKFRCPESVGTCTKK